MAVLMASEYAVGNAATRSRVGWRRRETELLVRLAALRETVFQVAGGEMTLPDPEWDGPWRSAETVSSLIHFCLSSLRSIRGADFEQAERLCGLILELQQLALDLYVHDTGQRSQRLADCAAGLSRLRMVPDTTALLDLACAEIVLRCGFQRAVLSRVDGHTWSPWLSHFAADTEGGSWLADWVDQRIPLDSRAPEAQLLTKRKPSLVYDTANAAVYRPIIVDAGRSRSYVVAPILHGADVVGFVHADHHPLPRRADEGDRDVLWAFTDGFSHIYERTVLLERLRWQRDHARELIADAVDRMDELCESGMEWSKRNAMDRADVAGHNGPIFGTASELTAREIEVFQLMIEGATNRAIAESLIITEGTVKSHVKHILRKFGAANRAQAIAWSLGRE